MEDQLVPPTPIVSQPVVSTAMPSTNSKKITLIILGILEIPFPALALYILFPLIKLQDTLGTGFVGPYLGLVFFVIALVIALAQILVGLFSYDIKLGKQKTKGLIILGLVLAALTIPALILSVVMPIYGNLQTIR